MSVPTAPTWISCRRMRPDFQIEEHGGWLYGKWTEPDGRGVVRSAKGGGREDRITFVSECYERIREIECANVEIDGEQEFLWPSGATAIDIAFSSDVSITSGEGTWSAQGVWTVWDATRVRQGAHMIEDKLTFAAACRKARKLVAERRKTDGPSS